MSYTRLGNFAHVDFTKLIEVGQQQQYNQKLGTRNSFMRNAEMHKLYRIAGFHETNTEFYFVPGTSPAVM